MSSINDVKTEIAGQIERGFAALREGHIAAEGVSLLAAAVCGMPEWSRSLIAPRAKEIAAFAAAESRCGKVPGYAILLLANLQDGRELVIIFTTGNNAVKREVLRAALACYRPAQLLSDFVQILPEVERLAYAAREDRWNFGIPVAFLAAAGLYPQLQRLYEASSSEARARMLRELSQVLPLAALRKAFSEEFLLAQLTALPRWEKHRRKALLRYLQAGGHDLHAVRKAVRSKASQAELPCAA